MDCQKNDARRDLKLARKLRYQRRYARNKPAAKGTSYPAELRLTPSARAACVIRGVPEYLQQVVRMTYGAKGTWGHGRYPNATKKGPGRRRIALSEQNHPAGTKLVKRFIRDARGEQVAYRNTYTAMTGEHYHERYS